MYSPGCGRVCMCARALCIRKCRPLSSRDPTKNVVCYRVASSCHPIDGSWQQGCARDGAFHALKFHFGPPQRRRVRSSGTTGGRQCRGAYSGAHGWGRRRPAWRWSLITDAVFGGPSRPGEGVRARGCGPADDFYCKMASTGAQHCSHHYVITDLN